MRRKTMVASIFILAFVVLLSGCDSNEKTGNPSQRLSVEEAKAIIQTSEKYTQSFPLNDITSDEIWKMTNRQLFKMVGGSSCDTFLVLDEKAIRIGEGLGGYGVTSAVPFDVNKDGTMDIVYAYSFGSGIHRSVISWLDLKTYEQFQVAIKPDRTGFRMEDLILKITGKQIIAYRISTDSAISPEVLFNYPSEKNIKSMTLVKEGTLFWGNNALVLRTK